MSEVSTPSDPDQARSLDVSPTRIRLLLDRAVDLAGEHDLDVVLQRIVESAAAVAGAQYAALGVYGDVGTIATFIHHGMDADAVERLGELPHGLGLLGQVIVADAPIRLDDLGADSRSCGFPVGHPPMRTFLGAPIARGGRRFGNLYLTEKHGGAVFDLEDEALVMALAAFAACAIESAELVAAERARVDAVARQVAAEEREHARRNLLGAVIAAQEEERARVSRDLHDDIGQALTSVMLGLRLIGNPSEGGVDDATRVQFDELRDLIADALRRTRRLAFELRPSVLDDIGLEAALRRLATDVAERSGLTVDAIVDALPERDVPSGVATVVYRVVQEALTNVVRHAGASTASVSVTVASGRLRVMVEDDGTGFDPDLPVDGHLGLQGMVERAELIGGTVRILSEPGSRTTIVLDVPFE